MSVQDNTAGFELNDSEFPELGCKLMGRKEKGRRSAVANRQARQAAKAGAFLVKTIEDPNHVLGKKRKERVASECHDGIASSVVYSMNKNKRWEAMGDDGSWDLNTNANAAAGALPVQLVERVMTAKDTLDNVVALKRMNLDGDVVRHETATGKGASLQSLLDTKKARKDRKHSEASSDASADENGEPTVQYTIYKPHKNHKLLAGKLFTRATNTRKAGKVRQHLKRVEIDEMDTSTDETMQQSVHADETSAYKPSRDFRFCLGDFLTADSCTSRPVFVRRPSIESVVEPSETTIDDLDVDIDTDVKEEVAESSLKEVTKVLAVPYLFRPVVVKFSDWIYKTIEQEVVELQKDKNLFVQWLDAESFRLSVDISRLVLDEKQPRGAPVSYFIIDRFPELGKKYVSVLLNFDFYPHKNINLCFLEHCMRPADSLRSLITILAKLARDWRQAMVAPEHVSRHKHLMSRFERESDLYRPSFNSSALSAAAHVLSAEKMATILRDESNNDEPKERFEHIDCGIDVIACDDFEEAEHFADYECPFECATCQLNDRGLLFELDDCWKCRACLGEEIRHQTAAKSVPLQIPFVLAEGQSAYDVLPAIIPIPLLNYYTRIAATETLASVPGAEVGECPSCKQLVHIDPAANEFGALSCVSCGIHWCSRCEHEPHFPMPCATYAEWINKWQREYEYHVVETTDELMRITCPCGVHLEGRGKAPRIECDTCGRAFCPTTMTLIENTYWTRDPATGEMVQRVDNQSSVVGHSVPASKRIKKETTDVCGEARKLRFSLSAKAEFEKAIRKIEPMYPGASRLKDIRKTALTLVENGLGYVYMDKRHAVNATKPVLMQLIKLWLDIEAEVHYPRADFQTRISTIEKHLAKVITMFKQIA